MSKEEFNKNAKLENLIWEIAQLLEPNSIINTEKIEKSKQSLLLIFNNNQNEKRF